jgi:predicted alpha/beta-fold hydrolase
MALRSRDVSPPGEPAAPAPVPASLAAPGKTASGAWWMPGGHLQTTWGRIGRRGGLVSYERELLTTPDDDDLVLDHVPGPPEAPRVILLHGLEGCSHSVYLQGLARLFARAGWRATAVNFRACARASDRARRWLPNRRPRLYHSGDSGDLDFVVRTLAAREPRTPLYAVGVSLGGNVLLKWLGEQGARSRIEAAATISVPYDLAAASRHLERRAGRFYANHFLKSLRAKALQVVVRHPAETRGIDPDYIRLAQTFWQFDDAATAPLHGFRDAEDYYRRASAIRHLGAIEVPTLCVSSLDDPFIPRETLQRAQDAASDDVSFAVTPWGGHAAFITGPWPWRALYWAEEQVVAWLTARPA